MDEDRVSTFLPEDIIVDEILLRLPAKPLFRFKCVSKRYNFIISHPKFSQNYHGLLASTFLFPRTHFAYRDYFSKNIKETIDPSYSQYCGNQDPLSISINAVSLQYNDHHRILASSNGLVLSFFIEWICHNVFGLTHLCVSNPLTKQCVKLPHYSRSIGNEVVDYGIITRRDQVADFLTYKILHISSDSVGIFSSDTGSWATWEVVFPKVRKKFPHQGHFAYKGILYWLNDKEKNLVTYNPYDKPDRLDRIKLPNDAKFLNSSLIYSGDEKCVRYCEIDDKCGSGFTRLSLWELSDDFEWMLEGQYRISSLPCISRICRRRIMVAPNPWKSDVICYPNVIRNHVLVISLRTGTWKLVDLFTPTWYEHTSVDHLLVYVELCPWYSPFCAQAKLRNSSLDGPSH